MNEGEEECSDTCRQMACEWCPEYDRQAALVDQWKAEIESMTLAELLASFPTEPPADPTEGREA